MHPCIKLRASFIYAGAAYPVLFAKLADWHAALRPLQISHNLRVAKPSILNCKSPQISCRENSIFSAANFRGSATQTPVNLKTASPATALVKALVLGYSVPKLEISCNETGAVSYTHLTLPTNREV